MAENAQLVSTTLSQCPATPFLFTKSKIWVMLSLPAVLELWRPEATNYNAIDLSQVTIYFFLLTTHYSLLTTHSSPFIFDHSQLNHSQLTIHFCPLTTQPFTIDHSPLTTLTHNLPITTHRSLLTFHVLTTHHPPP